MRVGKAAIEGPDERHNFYRQHEAQSLAPLWDTLSGLVPREPKPGAPPFIWRYDDVRPQLIQAGSLISLEEAERRVLVLQNLGLQDVQQIADTLYAGLRIILPGEAAPAHRHRQSALRFVIEGEGAYT